MVAASLRISIVIISACLIGYIVAVNGDYTSLVSRICNGKTYPVFSSAFDMPGTIIDSVINKVIKSPYFDVYDQVQNDNYVILYGHGSCSLNLDRDECRSCMNSARDQMFSVCSWQSVGAQIELQGCKLRYEEYYFEPPK